MMHKIVVDEDVWSFLKRHAEPFEDSPNSVLRRLLLTKDHKSIYPRTTSDANSELPDFHSGVPLALQQILEVAYAVKRLGYTRTDATHLVASKRSIAPQTVIDKYCRQLNKKAFEIDSLLDQHFDEFEALVVDSFTDHRDTIHDVLGELRE